MSDLLERLGPRVVSLASLVAWLRGRHPNLTPEEVETQLLDCVFTHDTGDGWVNLLAAADGAILTHFLTRSERDHNVLTADGDLDLWARLAGIGLPLAGGGEVITRHHPDTVTGADAELVGPRGWLQQFTAGQLLGLRLREGELQLGVVEAKVDQDRSQKLIAVTASSAWNALSAYLAVRESDPDIVPVARIGWAVADLVVAHPGVLDEPLRPLPELLRFGGLVVRRSTVMLPGLPPDPRQAAGLSDREVRARVALAAYARAWAGGDPVSATDGKLFLRLAAVSDAIEHLADLVECDPLPEPALATLRQLASTPNQSAAVELLAARSVEGAGQSIRAENLVISALTHNPELHPAVLDAADYAATRSDTVAAEGFLKRAGRSRDDPRRVALAKVVTPPATSIARAQRCPCGSGLKYRRCCLRFAVHPLPTRAALVYARLAWYAYRAPRRGTVAWLEQLMDLTPPDAALLPIDLAIFDTGIVDDYLAARGELMRSDERELIDRWRQAPIAPYEVTKVRDRAYVTLRPLLGGESSELRNRSLANTAYPQDLLVARVLYDGERDCLMIPPRLVSRDRLAELCAVFADYSPESLAAFFGPPACCPSER